MSRLLPTLLFLLILLHSGQLAAQQKIRCGTVAYMERLKSQDQSYDEKKESAEALAQRLISENQQSQSSRTVVTIPVVFHIMYLNATQNISTNRITDQLATLNKDFGRYNTDTGNTPLSFRSVSANTNIQFCFAQRDPNGDSTNGIVRVQVTVAGFDPMSNDHIKYTAQGGDDAWPRDQYLNIWIANFTGNSSQILGISQLPGNTAATDGCCILYTSVGGTTYPGTELYYNLGRTLTHEVGHWLNLIHIWGDDGGTCNGDDSVTDTPKQASETYGCPTQPKTDACTPNLPGVMYMNYLDYSDDNCMNMFTEGQASRMNACLNGTRLSIKSSSGCMAPIGINELANSIIDFSVFPNPVSSICIVSFRLNRNSDLKLIVTNMIGQPVFSKELKNVSVVKLPIDLADASPGIYNLSLRTTDAVANKKIILGK